MDDALLWLALRLAPGVPRRRVHELRERLGTPAQVVRALGVPLPLDAARRELERAQQLGLRILALGARGFPASLANIPDPPLALYLRGELPRGPCVAMVGSRRPSVRGRSTALDFAAQLARSGVSIVSGLAYGIDAAAHEGALSGAGVTVAVLASGLDRPSPAGNRRLARRILEQGGAWVSEYEPGTPAHAHHFPERNRLISGLAPLTLVVEAREASGTLWTARHALEQDRDLMVVPGPIDSEQYRGSNRLLRDGAGPALEAGDLLLALGLEPRAEPGPADPAGEAGRVLAALGNGPQNADRLAQVLSLSPAQLAGYLLELELDGRIERRGNRIARL